MSAENRERLVEGYTARGKGVELLRGRAQRRQLGDRVGENVGEEGEGAYVNHSFTSSG